MNVDEMTRPSFGTGGKIARFCTAKYETPTKSNFKKAYMHLTNYSINKMNDEYIKPSEGDIMMDNDATKRTLTSLYETLAAQGIDVQQIKANIAGACGKIM